MQEEQDYHTEDESQEIPHKTEEGLCKQSLEILGVITYPGHQVADLHTVMKSKAQPLDVLKELRLDLKENPLSEYGQEIAAEQAGKHSEDQQACEPDYDPVQEPEIALWKDMVDYVPRDQRERQLEQYRGHHGRPGHETVSLPGLEIWQESAYQAKGIPG
jgi:hypothetical protein